MLRFKQSFHESFQGNKFHPTHFVIFVFGAVIISVFNSYYCGDGTSIETCIETKSIEECYIEDNIFRESLSDGYCKYQYSFLVAKPFITSTFLEEVVFLISAFLVSMLITLSLGLKSNNQDSKHLSWLIILKNFSIFVPIWFSCAYAFLYMMALYVS